ncbi:sulfatase-like hydrolase/transferase [Halosimplex halophilum]|uniref:sulfatase-like hydrolase/transferase n=1 Tax=Halosimplex halophilum TaxID=2559572 RepID=UPI00107F46F8|nr:sulfatase-like hydrolase/transferase [Halosimplex halophilum]
MTNIALVVMDTLRKDSFDEHFDWLPGARYENAWSPGGWTVPVHATLFGGLYSSELGVYAKTTALDCEKPVLAEHLSRAGYTTRGFSANANIADAFQFTRGFDEFHHSWRGRRRDPDIVDWAEFISETRGEGPTRFLRAVRRCFADDVDTVESLKFGVRMKARDLGIASIAGEDDGASEVLDLVESTDFGDDEFLFVNLMEAHGPYNAPEEYRTVDVSANPSFEETVGDGPEADPADVRQAYEDCVRYLSDVYRDIFAELREEFDVVVTLSDHGEMFGEDDVWGHNHGLYPELTHVPLTVWDGGDAVETREETVGLLDVYRTVLSAAGVADDEARGRDLRADRGSRSYLTERHGLRSERISHLRNQGYDEATVERYDAPLNGAVVEDGSYGCETLDGFRTWGDTDEATVRAAIDEVVDTLAVRDVALGEGQDLPSDVEERLSELGYV